MTKTLKYMPYANARVIISDDGMITLVSYTTSVVQIDPEGFVTCNGLYSATTRKHISAFAREYLAPLTYHDLKMAYFEGYSINYKTGEIEPY